MGIMTTMMMAVVMIIAVVTMMVVVIYTYNRKVLFVCLCVTKNDHFAQRNLLEPSGTI